jgi:hypothetical protein
MHPIFTLWSTSEPELSPVLLEMAAAVERNTQAQQHVLVTFTPNIVQVSMLFYMTCWQYWIERESMCACVQTDTQ